MLSRRTLLLASPVLLCASRLRAAPAQRIVSIGGAVTEILYRLGHADEIVGVDSTSLYPEEALKTKANVGYVRALGAEGILSLNPTLVIASEGAGPPDALRLVEQAGVAIVRVPDEPSAAGIAKRVEVIAQAVNAVEKGAARNCPRPGRGWRVPRGRSSCSRFRTGGRLSAARERPPMPCSRWPAPPMSPPRSAAGSPYRTRA
jgi:ABC-type hemin transport system substrate-binding protein